MMKIELRMWSPNRGQMVDVGLAWTMQQVQGNHDRINMFSGLYTLGSKQPVYDYDVFAFLYKPSALASVKEPQVVLAKVYWDNGAFWVDKLRDSDMVYKTFLFNFIESKKDAIVVGNIHDGVEYLENRARELLVK
jgi:hypothetical protein